VNSNVVSDEGVRAKKANVYPCFPDNAQLAMTRTAAMIVSWMNDVAMKFTAMIEGIGADYAKIPNDTPSMPMADFDGKTSGGGG
jgi:hypothetical protein